VLRFLGKLGAMAVLPHRLFTLSSVITAGGLLYWLWMDFGCVRAHEVGARRRMTT
jgi:hypothetical protein